MAFIKSVSLPNFTCHSGQNKDSRSKLSKSWILRFAQNDGFNRIKSRFLMLTARTLFGRPLLLHTYIVGALLRVRCFIDA